MNDNKSRDIFYGVVAVATLIVALVGATLAYFSISASSAEGVVNAQAATIRIEYSDGQQVTAQADELIPATLQVVQDTYQYRSDKGEFNTPVSEENASNKCLDAEGQQVCSIYRFSVRSDVPRTILATLNNEHNGFTFLSYAVRDVTNNAWLTLDEAGNKSLPINACDNANEDDQDDCHSIETGLKTYGDKAINSIYGYTGTGLELKPKTITLGTTAQVYDLVIFINENNTPQNVDQGKTYNGTIIVDVTDGGQQITGSSDFKD